MHLHNHADRGVLHPDCPGCQLLTSLLDDAGCSAIGYHHPPSDTALTHSLTIHGVEMGNRAKVEAEQLAAADAKQQAAAEVEAEMDAVDAAGYVAPPLVQLANALLARYARPASGGYGALALGCHLLLEHPSISEIPGVSTLFDSSTPVLRDLQALHTLAHHGEDNPHESSPEHMVRAFDVQKLRSLAQLHQQKAYSATVKEHKAYRALQRREAAQAQREQIIIDSARNLNRAIEHALGTVVTRTKMIDLPGGAQIKVGMRRPLTVAIIHWDIFLGLGTAICKDGDRWDPQIGTNLAIGRAFISLGANQTTRWLDKERTR